jgi:hypothetical protein
LRKNQMHLRWQRRYGRRTPTFKKWEDRVLQLRKKGG